ncbi:MAG: GAF domain-containing protein [Candidatus Omnitrophica bacterium]|nr:GAF domain-containing protein [Candidatus Omnitrophota bacterium]
MNTQVAKGSIAKRLAQIIAKLDDLDKFLNSLTEMVVEEFKVAWATLSLLDDSGRYKLKASAQSKPGLEQNNGPSAEMDSWLKERQKTLSQRLLDEFGPQMSQELRAELGKADTSASMPLFAGEDLIGVLNFGPGIEGRPLSKEDLELFTDFTQLIASVIKQAVALRTLSEQRLHHQNVLDNLVSGIIVIDPEDKITVFNRAAERILKLTSDPVLGKDVRILQPNFANLLLDTLHKGITFRREELYVQPENALIGVSTSQFYNSKGKLLGACMVFSGLSEVRRSEKAQRQQNLESYWSNVANSLAHEVKNSIVATKVFTDMFPEKYEDAEFRWSLYSTLKRDMGKLDKFSNKVLNFAQSHELVMQPCKVDKVMDVAINSVFQDRDLDGISFEKRYSQNLKALPADYHQLKEVFTQIISNALEAMDKTGKLTISLEQESNPKMLIYNLPELIKELPEGEVIVVKISDTGSGISPEDLPHLFDPFFTTKEGRTGLGLSTARKIVQAHQGVIKVESEPGTGSTFWICLPC